MPVKKSDLRARVAPCYPLDVSFEDRKGAFTKRYFLAFNLNVLAAITEKTGLYSLSDDIWRRMDAKVLRASLWAALLPEQPEFDTRDRDGKRTDEGIETVGSWLDAENQEKAVMALSEAWLLYLPKDEADRIRAERTKSVSGTAGGEDPLAGAPVKTESPANSDGSNSGPSAGTTLESAPIEKSES